MFPCGRSGSPAVCWAWGGGWLHAKSGSPVVINTCGLHGAGWTISWLPRKERKNTCILHYANELSPVYDNQGQSLTYAPPGLKFGFKPSDRFAVIVWKVGAERRPCLERRVKLFVCQDVVMCGKQWLNQQGAGSCGGGGRFRCAKLCRVINCNGHT